MGSPSRVTLLGALQSWYLSLKEGLEKGGDSCFHGRPWAKRRVWRGDLSVLWTRTVDVAARFGHQGGESRGIASSSTSSTRLALWMLGVRT